MKNLPIIKKLESVRQGFENQRIFLSDLFLKIQEDRMFGLPYATINGQETEKMIAVEHSKIGTYITKINRKETDLNFSNN